MSRGAPQTREELLGELVRELRQFTGLGASFFRAAAGRVGLTAADVQVIDILDAGGPTTAGRLAAFTGLTTGAITQMLDRLEAAGLVHRERDPADGRRVVVRLAGGEVAAREIGPIVASLGGGWDAVASRYDDAQLALLVEFVVHANAATGEEIARLREAPDGGGGEFSAPREGVASGRLVFASGASRLTLRADADMAVLYRARFQGAVPKVQAEGGTVTIRYPRRLRLLDRREQTAEIALTTAVPWEIEIRGGASEVVAVLGDLDLAGLAIRGGASTLRVELPEPAGTVPVRIAGGASEVVVRRPAGVAARVHLTGWASHLVFDDQSYDAMGRDVRLQSPGYDAAPRRYDIEVSGSASAVTLAVG
ncbi:MAG: MarR family transcriptional regulator [Chloroflexota bacterium]|nr:MarR family transcriptional regulator [Chloroflexota bacterium]